jgi:hypothetical protein
MLVNVTAVLLKVVCPAGRVTVPTHQQDVGDAVVNVILVLKYISTVTPDPKVPPLNTVVVRVALWNTTGFVVMVPDAAFAGIGETPVSTDGSSKTTVSRNKYLALLNLCIRLHLKTF